MRVNFPVKSKESIDFAAIDFYEGVVLTNNPKGFIQYVDGSYYLYTTSHADNYVISEDSMQDFAEKVMEEFPEIIVEYFEQS